MGRNVWAGGPRLGLIHGDPLFMPERRRLVPAYLLLALSKSLQAIQQRVLVSTLRTSQSVTR